MAKRKADGDSSSPQPYTKGVKTDDGGRRGTHLSASSSGGGESLQAQAQAPSSLTHSATATKGRAARQKQHMAAMSSLNYHMYQWAKKKLASGEIPNDEFYDGAVANYLSNRDKIHFRYNREYGDIYTFGQGDCGQLGCGEAVTEARIPKVLVRLRGKQINQVASGGLHSVALCESGKVTTWGCNDEGSLGYNAGEDNEDGAFPFQITGFYPSQYGPNGATFKNGVLDDNGQFIPFIRRKNATISSVAAGETQSLALSTTGDVYQWGTMKDNEGRKFRNMPPEDDKRTPTGFKDMDALEEDENPKYYHPPQGNQDWPSHVVEITKKVNEISAGASYNAALLEDNTIVTWGVGDTGELARPVPNLDKKTSMELIKSQYLKPQPPIWAGPELKRTVLTISCGGYHFLVSTREQGGLSVYSSGLNNYGQLGLGDTDNRNELTKVDFFAGKDITKIEGGLQFSSFVDQTGKELYVCGRGDYGQLGTTFDKPDAGYHETVPRRVPLLYYSQSSVPNMKQYSYIADDIVEKDQPEIEQISCGSTHVLVLTKGGDAYSWGFGDRGACGQGKSEEDVLRPTKLEAKTKKSTQGGGANTSKFHYVSGGGQHSCALVTTHSLN